MTHQSAIIQQQAAGGQQNPMAEPRKTLKRREHIAKCTYSLTDVPVRSIALDTLAPELMLHLVRGVPVGNRSIGAVIVGYTLKRHVPRLERLTR